MESLEVDQSRETSVVPGFNGNGDHNDVDRALFGRVLAKLREPWWSTVFLAWNFGIAASQMAFGILIFEMSPLVLVRNAQRITVFPLSLPHAIALTAFCWKSFYVAPGVLAGFYGNRLYYLVHGVQELTALRGCLLFLEAVIRAAGVCSSGYLIRKLVCTETKRLPTIDGLRDAIHYCWVVLVVNIFSETLVSLVLCLGRLLAWKDFGLHTVTWWLGGVAAIVTITPFLIHGLNWKPSSIVWTPTKLLEVAFVTVCLLAVLLLVFLLNMRIYFRPLPYLIYPVIVYTAFRFNRMGWALVLLVFSTFCAWTTVEGKGVLYNMSGGSLEPRLVVQIELFISVCAGVSIALTAAVREKSNIAKNFEKLNEGLGTLVHRRTEELSTAHEELQATQITAEMASKAKSDFLTNVSHEIRTPIHGILGMSALIGETELTAQQYKSMTIITECADLLLQVMNSILDLAKIESGRFEVKSIPFDIRHVLTTTMHIIESAKQNDVELKWSIDHGVPEVLIGDGGKLRQCLLNTIANAVKFTKQGSVEVKVSLQANAMEDEDTATALSKIDKSNWPYVPEGVVEITETRTLMVPSHNQEFSVQRPPGDEVKLLFKISDSGIGISKEKIQDILNPFCQADPSVSRVYGGTGLGLSIVQRYVELMGGNFMIDTEVGKRSTFYIFLPFYMKEGVKPDPVLSPKGYYSFQGHNRKAMTRSQAEAQEKPKTAVSFDSPPADTRVPPPACDGVLPDTKSPNLRILLAEDNVVNQRIAIRLLQRSGHKVFVANDGAEAVAAVHSDRSSFDVVLMDIQMPNMDGLEATKRIRSEEIKLRCKRVPIIGVTAHALQGYQDLCFESGMDEYLAKPFEISKLLNVIDRVLSRHFSR